MSSAKDHNLGKTLGDYSIDRLIAKGGMGRVYEATDHQLDRKVAVKIITLDEEVADELMDRFKREARVIGQLDAHPNIVTIYRYGKDEGLHYIAMKYIQGQSLADRMRDVRNSKQPFPGEELLYVLRQVAAALDYAHEQGVIHRDVKPANIMLEEDPTKPGQKRAILMDFGLVLRVNNTMTTGSAFGTPRYISPEQAISSAQASPQSDIYSLGVVVYELLTGKPPFDDEETPIAVALSHVTKPPPNPKLLRPDIPDAVVGVLMKVLAKKPEDRYQSATTFVDALEAALLGKPAPRNELVPVRAAESPSVISMERPLSVSRRPKQTSRDYILPTLLLLVIFLGLGALAANLILKEENGQIAALATEELEAIVTEAVEATASDTPEPTSTEETTDVQLITAEVETEIPVPTPTLTETVAATATATATETEEPETEPTSAPAPTEVAVNVSEPTQVGEGAVEFIVVDGTLVVRTPGNNRDALWLVGVELRQGDKVFNFADFGLGLLEAWRPGTCAYVTTINREFTPSDQCSSTNPRTLRYVRDATFPWLEGQFEVYQGGERIGECDVSALPCQISGIKRSES